MNGFTCASCGKWHDELPLDLAFAEPLQVAELDEGERARSLRKIGDFRVLERGGEIDRFVRGVIEIPILGFNDFFLYGAWVSLSAQSFESARAADTVDAEAGPFFGWLSNRIAGYPDTLNLKTHVRMRPRVRAAIELEPTDHPLALEQRNGITLDRVKAIVEPTLHPAR
jgi:hypothetical protein